MLVSNSIFGIYLYMIIVYIHKLMKIQDQMLFNVNILKFKLQIIIQKNFLSQIFYCNLNCKMKNFIM